MTLVIGLTGSIATGKSTVSNLFRQQSIPVIDADIISRRVVEPNQPAYVDIISAFGEDILDVDHSIDRSKLAKIIFNDEKKRYILERIVHPRIIEQLKDERDRLKHQNYPLIVLDVPLLFEKELDDLVDAVLVVYTSRTIQLNRLMARDQFTEAEAKKRINSQLSIDEKAKRADFLIDNTKDLDETTRQFNELLDQWVNGS